MAKSDKVSERSRLMTLVLAISLGFLGFHRIFTGHRSSGIVQMVTSSLSIMGAYILYFFNKSLFEPQRIVPVSLGYYLLVVGLMTAALIPLVLVFLWVMLDVGKILFNRFDDADGHRVELWFIANSF